MSNLVSLGLVDLKGALTVFYPWCYGFNTTALQEDLGAMYTCTKVFLGLEKEWRKVLPKLGASIGKILAFQ